MSREKRTGEMPIPHDIHNYLNEAQQAVLAKIQDFGWSLHFIRRPLFQQPTVVACNANGSAYGVLEDDGHFNTDAALVLRG